MKLFKLLILAILFIFPFGQLTKLPLGIPEVNIYFQDLLIGILVISWVVWHLVKRIPFPRTTLAKPILFFIAIAGLSLAINSSYLESREILVASLYLIRWSFYASIYFVVNELKFIKWEQGLILAGTVTAILGLIQYFLYPDLGNLSYLGWDIHKFRVFGTFLDPSFLGMILVLTILLIIDSAIAIPSIPITYYLLLTTSYLALALTYSRSSYLAFLAGIGVIAWIKKTPKIFILSVLLIILTIILLPRPSGSEGVKLERENSVWGKVKNWQQSLIIFKDKPILGIGFNAYRYAQREYGFISEKDWQESHAGAGADSSLLFVMATTGIVGFISFLWLGYKIIILNIGKTAAVSSLAAIFIHSWFANTLFYPWIMIWMWILVGCHSDPPTGKKVSQWDPSSLRSSG